MRLICIGDSLIEYFDWQQRLSAHEVWNLGRSGETVQELLGRVESVTTKMEEPDRLLIMTGINNVAQEDYGFLPSYDDLLARFRQAWPQTEVAVNCLLPVRLSWVAPDALPRLNDRLAAMAAAHGIFFLHNYEDFLDCNGMTDERCLLPDGVHISEEGYGRWSQKIEEWLDA